jgi:hypothetical protein
VDETGNHSVKWNKPSSERWVLLFHRCIDSKRSSHRRPEAPQKRQGKLDEWVPSKERPGSSDELLTAQ